MQRLVLPILSILFALPAFALPPTWSEVSMRDFAGGFASGPLPLTMTATNPFCVGSAFATATATVSSVDGKLRVDILGTADPSCSIAVEVNAVAHFTVPADGDAVTQILWTLGEQASASTGVDSFAFQARRDDSGALSAFTGGRFKHPEVLLNAETGSGVPIPRDRVSGLHAFIPGDTIAMPWVVSIDAEPSASGASIEETFTLEASMLSLTVPGISGTWSQLVLSTVLLTIGAGLFLVRRQRHERPGA